MATAVSAAAAAVARIAVAIRAAAAAAGAPLWQPAFRSATFGRATAVTPSSSSSSSFIGAQRRISRSSVRWTSARHQQAAPNVAPDQRLRLVAAAVCEPHPEKVATGGEDAHFIDPGGRGVGVADGVGGWQESGINPGFFSASLMREVQQLVTAAPPDAVMDPVDILDRAHRAVNVLGSSTAVIGLLSNGRKLGVANLGDSGLMVIRQEAYILRTVAQTHDFNFPYQLSGPGATERQTTAAAAEVLSLDLEPMDVIVLASDGVFDNLHDALILKVVSDGFSPFIGNPSDILQWAQETADTIVSMAKITSASTTKRTPFSEAARVFGYPYIGGKKDDITCVVAVACPESSFEDVTY